MLKIICEQILTKYFTLPISQRLAVISAFALFLWVAIPFVVVPENGTILYNYDASHDLRKTSSKQSKHFNLLLKWLQCEANNNTISAAFLYYFRNFYTALLVLLKCFTQTEKILVSQSLVCTTHHPSNLTFKHWIYLLVYEVATTINCIINERILDCSWWIKNS